MKRVITYWGGVVVVVMVILFLAPSTYAAITVVPRTQEQFLCVKGNETPKSAEAKQLYAKETVIIYYTPTPTPTTVKKEAVLSVNTEALIDKPASLDSEAIFQMINNHRASLGLPVYQKEEKLCSLARERGPELYNEIFVTGNIHGGFSARNIPFWITENMKHGSSEQDVFNWWLGSSIHRRGIEGNFTYSCGECYGNSCVQLFTSYVPK